MADILEEIGVKSIIGNFTTQANRDFPLDCELFASLQGNIELTALLGNIVGDKVILWGCEIEGNNNRRKEGYVFVRTKYHPKGEILYFEGGNILSGMYLKEETQSITAQGYVYTQAYTIRSLAAGTGSENFTWDDFKELAPLAELWEKINVLEEKVAALSYNPLGFPELFAGETVPDGYALCDGRELKQSEYDELYKILGSTYNEAPNFQGVKFQTEPGFFRLPDLRGRFIVGYNPSDAEYQQIGWAGGSKSVSLDTKEIPPHVHSYLGPGEAGDHPLGSAGDPRPVNEILLKTGIAGGTGNPDNEQEAERMLTNPENYTAAHENRPPWYTLAYIMKLK